MQKNKANNESVKLDFFKAHSYQSKFVAACLAAKPVCDLEYLKQTSLHRISDKASRR